MDNILDEMGIDQKSIISYKLNLNTNTNMMNKRKIQSENRERNDVIENMMHNRPISNLNSEKNITKNKNRQNKVSNQISNQNISDFDFEDELINVGTDDVFINNKMYSEFQEKQRNNMNSKFNQ